MTAPQGLTHLTQLIRPHQEEFAGPVRNTVGLGTKVTVKKVELGYNRRLVYLYENFVYVQCYNHL